MRNDALKIRMSYHLEAILLAHPLQRSVWTWHIGHESYLSTSQDQLPHTQHRITMVI